MCGGEKVSCNIPAVCRQCFPSRYPIGSMYWLEVRYLAKNKCTYLFRIKSQEQSCKDERESCKHFTFLNSSAKTPLRSVAFRVVAFITALVVATTQQHISWACMDFYVIVVVAPRWILDNESLLTKLIWLLFSFTSYALNTLGISYSNLCLLLGRSK